MSKPGIGDAVKNPQYPCKVITGKNTRLSYEHVWEPVSINGGKPKYSACCMIPKTDTETVEEIRRAMEADDRLGMVEQYLDILLPENWRDMDLYERRNYLADRKDPTLPKGKVLRRQVTNLEIWSECFGRNPADMKAADSYTIAAIMVQLDGWEKSWERKRIPIYGQQRLYLRKADYQPVKTDVYCDRKESPVPEFLN